MRKEILTTLMRRAYRRPSTAADMEWVQGFYQEGRREGTFRGWHRAGRCGAF